MKELDNSLKIHRFDESEIEDIELPQLFTFPFYYTPHPICVIASEQLQREFLMRGFSGHNFGLDPNEQESVIGKMFGVLVVYDEEGQLGYLAGFSGKLASSNHHESFVPPVYDILDPEGFFLKEEEAINLMNRQIEKMEMDEELHSQEESHQNLLAKSERIISTFKAAMNSEKKQRKAERKSLQASASEADYTLLHERHKSESLQQQFELRELKAYWAQEIERSEKTLNLLLAPLHKLRRKRKIRSASLQSRLFQEYSFLNIEKKEKSLNEIFHQEMDVIPPAGAGECAAPKLLHYAFRNNLKPIALAEFWWGASPNSEIRKHKLFYHACRGKCEPILKHMLSGMEIDANPLLENAADFELDVIYEDSAIIVINKPTEVLSVPGKNIEMSVLHKLRLAYPTATGPLLIHRLDMSTSGILIAAKNKDIHKDLQAQFMRRSVKKTYVAVLDGIIERNEGVIDLPLRVDLNNRPNQLVCFEHGKRSVTKFRVIARENGKTRVHFFPITGRTHQLRVHSAHSLGLACPILGDDLYGRKAERLHLHAEQLEIIHPVSKESLKFKLEAPF